MENLVAPAYPELFASGCIINAFTPQDRRDTETLIESIRAFKVDIVLVVDNEKLENDVRNYIRNDQIKVI